MNCGVSSSATAFPSLLCKSRTSFSHCPSNVVISRTPSPSNPKLNGFRISSRRGSRRCYSSTRPSGPASDDREVRSILDAFFLGKALAEALNERIESTVGEFLSTVGRIQAEQQKQVIDFQEEVLERAKKAKEKAAREAMEEQGLISKPTENMKPVTSSVASGTSDPTNDAVTPSNPSSSPGQNQITVASGANQETSNKGQPV